MTTVREAAFALLRERSMTTVFGNPGSTELPMLTEFPTDFRYILGLQEATVVGLADGYAQASGRPTLVNLHTAPGVGNAMGAIFNAQANKSPLVITAGQQYRSLMTLQANLTNRDAVRMVHPLVKWSYEPPRAEDVPHALARAIHAASLPPRGPSFLSIPMDDWGVEVDEGAVGHQTTRTVIGAAQPGPELIARLAERLARAERPVLVAGPDIDASGGWDAAIRLAELQRLPVYATPATGGGRIGFPEDHPLFQGILPPAVLPVGEMLASYDLVLAVGTSIFPYYPNVPGPLLADGTALVAITADPDEAARAPMGDAFVADPALTLAALAATVGESGRTPPPPRPAPEAVPLTDPMSPSTAVRALAEVFPQDGIVVLESPSATLALRNQLRLSTPGSYYFSSGGGLGFGMPAAIGVQLAQPNRPVVCVIGEGSAQYAIQSLWTAAAYDVPVTFLVLRNDEYAILKWFGMLEDIVSAPGLDLPALDCAAVASGYGVNSTVLSSAEELGEGLGKALASDRPELVEVRVSPGWRSHESRSVHDRLGEARHMSSTPPDAIVIGAGLAGLVSTLELLRSGHTVLLLDRCEPREVGGLAREAFGGMFMVDSPEQRRSRIPDNERLALEDWLRIAEFDPEDLWPRRWAEQYVTRARDDVGAWLREIGVKFFPVVNWAERGNFGDGNSVPRFHLTWGTGKALVQAVWAAIESHPRRQALEVRFRSRVVELLIDDGAARGVKLESGLQEHAGKAVVIAAGGIGGNLEIVRREWPTDRLGPPPKRLLMGSHYYADGALHEEVKRIGGNVTHLSRMWNYADAVRHPKPQREHHGLKLIPPRSGLMLSPDGHRYGPVPVMPTFDAYAALERMCEDERKYSWLICNFKIAKKELDVSGSQHNPHLRERRLLPFLLSVLTGKPGLVNHFLEGSPDFVSAGSLPELAAKMNEVTSELTGERAIDAAVLEREVGRYDDTIARGKGLFNDDQLRRIAQLRKWRGDRLRTARFQRIVDPKAGPLIAIRLQVMARKSLGGIQTDLGCRVLREGDEPVQRLYAVGEAAGFGGGGVHGKRSLEGTFLGGCVFTGRLAAATIAEAELPLRIPPRIA